MNLTDMQTMTAMIFAPSVFALLLLLIPKGKEELMRWVALLGSAVTLGLSIIAFMGFLEIPGVVTPGSQGSLEARVDAAAKAERVVIKPDGTSEGGAAPASNDWVARIPWIKQFNIEYFIGLDGISMSLVLLTTALCFLALMASWPIEKHVRAYLMLFLLLETGMIGCFLALDFFLFYIFWEVMLLPMYFLIGVWGGPRREYASIKFFLYTLLGSVFILIAMLGFYFTDVRDFVDTLPARQEKAMELARAGGASDPRKAIPNYMAAVPETEVHSFDLIALSKAGRAAALNLNERPDDAAKDSVNPSKNDVKKRFAEQSFFSSKQFQIAMFLLLFIGFAIKVPVFPFHTWLPDAHVEAPTPISMILAGVLLKLGGYGILRICYPICPWAAEALAYYLALFGVINIVYGAFAAMAQTDFKKLVAYSSVSHMGYVILGIAVWSALPKSQFWSWGMNGAMFQMLAHGITSAGMFFLVGVIYDRAHHRNLDNFRGLMEPMPLYSGISAIMFFAAMGLPGMCGFVGEVFVVLGTWNYSKPIAIAAAFAVILTAAYILWTLQRVYFGTNPAYKDYKDMSLRELAIAIPLLVASVALGVFPNQLIFSWLEPSVTGLVETLSKLSR